MKKIFVVLSIALLSCDFTPPKKRKLVIRKCLIDSVVFYGVGQKSTLQFSPIWEAHTDCGIINVSRSVCKGDTIAKFEYTF